MSSGVESAVEFFFGLAWALWAPLLSRLIPPTFQQDKSPMTRRVTQVQYEDLQKSIKIAEEESGETDLKKFETDERQISFIRATLEKNENITKETVHSFA